MTTIYSTAEAAPATAFGGFTRVLGDWANGLATYWVRREAIKALRAMNDRELRDIGITRSHIEEAVWGRCAIRPPVLGAHPDRIMFQKRDDASSSRF
jgi:uncharacterized protein YjiS (DUF1127 family)